MADNLTSDSDNPCIAVWWQAGILHTDPNCFAQRVGESPSQETALALSQIVALNDHERCPCAWSHPDSVIARQLWNQQRPQVIDQALANTTLDSWAALGELALLGYECRNADDPDIAARANTCEQVRRTRAAALAANEPTGALTEQLIALILRQGKGYGGIAPTMNVLDEAAANLPDGSPALRHVLGTWVDTQLDLQVADTPEVGNDVADRVSLEMYSAMTHAVQRMWAVTLNDCILDAATRDDNLVLLRDGLDVLGKSSLLVEMVGRYGLIDCGQDMLVVRVPALARTLIEKDLKLESEWSLPRTMYAPEPNAWILGTVAPDTSDSEVAELVGLTMQLKVPTARRPTQVGSPLETPWGAFQAAVALCATEN